MAARNIRGRSPRARGRLAAPRARVMHPGSIPARAGETVAARSQRRIFRVDPRARGGNPLPRPTPSRSTGRSPRARGKPEPAELHVARRGSIPARAGETLATWTAWASTTVDPRARGGNPRQGRKRPLHGGRSPRARGKQILEKARQMQLGSIPARAGETGYLPNPASTPEVDPRARGGNARRAACRPCGTGRSPRARGKPRPSRRSPHPPRSIPARAGETAFPTNVTVTAQVDPRARGGDYYHPPLWSDIGGRSPRARGRRAGRSPALASAGSIPARAGETPLPPPP